MDCKISIFIILTLLIVVSSCAPAETKQCMQDSDCVPAQCCHATSAVSKDAAPDCQGKICTLDCNPNTMDCGQGEIKCVQSKCVAILTS